jgi:hypothetical protein
MDCPYANLLGVPGQGVHSRRIFGLALNDTLATILVSALTSYFFNISFIMSFIVWFILGEVLHYVMGVNTEFLAMLNIRPCN